MSRDEELLDQVGMFLATRPGWSLEPSPTPGLPPSWCLISQGEVDLSVTIVDGALSIYRPETDQELSLDSVADLDNWIAANDTRFT
jgi:hypothetical protein